MTRQVQNHPILKLVFQDEETKIYSASKTVRGKVHNQIRVCRNDAPEFYIESATDGSSDTIFLRKAANNEMIGLLTGDGELDRHKEWAEKVHYFSTLHLKPKQSANT